MLSRGIRGINLSRLCPYLENTTRGEKRDMTETKQRPRSRRQQKDGKIERKREGQRMRSERQEEKEKETQDRKWKEEKKVEDKKQVFIKTEGQYIRKKSGY